MNLPATEEKMLMIPQFTIEKFSEFGKELLQVTKNYNAEKAIDLEKSVDSGDENTDSVALGNQASASSITSLGRSMKRKVKWTIKETIKRARKIPKKTIPKKRSASPPGKAPAAKKQLLLMPGTSSC